MRAAAVDRRLEAVAGPLHAANEVANSEVLFPEIDLLINGITLFGVVDYLSLKDSWRLFAATQSLDGQTRAGFQTLLGDSPGISYRIDQKNGGTNETITNSSAGVGRHVFALSIDEGAMRFRTVTDGAISTYRNLTAGDPVVNRLNLFSATAYTVPLWSGLYDRAMSDGELVSVTGWLAQRFSLSLSLSRSLTRANYRLAA